MPSDDDILQGGATEGLNEDEAQTTRILASRTESDSSGLAGQVVAGKILIEQKLGAGGAGAVYQGTDQDLGDKVAVKILRNVSPDSIQRFKREAKSTRKLDHPNILRLFDFGAESDFFYIVMEYLSGKTLYDIIKTELPLPLPRTLGLIKQAAAGLGHAHENGVLHRDVKPANLIVILNSKNEEIIKVVDFGIAKLMDSEGEPSLTTSGRIFGTPLYMSPEQIQGKEVDARSDIYSLGCLFYECLTGAPPHVGSSPLETLMLHQTEEALPLTEASMGAVFPEAIEQIVLRMVAKKPADRFSDMQQLLKALSDAERAGLSPAGNKLRKAKSAPIERNTVQHLSDLMVIEIPIQTLQAQPSPLGKSTVDTRGKVNEDAKPPTRIEVKFTKPVVDTQKQVTIRQGDNTGRNITIIVVIITCLIALGSCVIGSG